MLSIPTSATLAPLVRQLALGLMSRPGLYVRAVTINRHEQTPGVCRYDAKLIEVSVYLVHANGTAEWLDTILSRRSRTPWSAPGTATTTPRAPRTRKSGRAFVRPPDCSGRTPRRMYLGYLTGMRFSSIVSGQQGELAIGREVAEEVNQVLIGCPLLALIIFHVRRVGQHFGK